MPVALYIERLRPQGAVVGAGTTDETTVPNDRARAGAVAPVGVAPCVSGPAGRENGRDGAAGSQCERAISERRRASIFRRCSPTVVVEMSSSAAMSSWVARRGTS